MALTFTQVPVTLRVNKAVLAYVINELDILNPDEANKVYTIETSFHVGSMEAANRIENGINNLQNLGVLDAYQTNNAFNQIQGFRQNYLR